MEIILGEAQKRNMKVWILDDKHFPTGYANGLIQKKYPERRRWFLREHHVDLLGPMKDTSVVIPRLGEEETLLGVCAYRRPGEDQTLSGEPVVFPVPQGRFLFLDVPEGCWRVFFLIQTRSLDDTRHEWYMDMLSESAVQVLLEAVYESHYAHFARYFGNTLEGFFSDEPGLDCPYIGPWGEDRGFYFRTVGQPGVALPWSAAIPGLMEQAGTEAPIAALPTLWYAHEGSGGTRLNYMDAVTGLWRKNFSLQLGNWCRGHGVKYIGHIIEDMNAHARLGCSGGHFFRSLDGQDMSGMDIVLHQVMPGCAHLQTAASHTTGTTNPRFFHYVLAQLAASHARFNPRLKNRAMCEVFGAFGWAESLPFMKWLMDFLLIRGITHFVPHAFTDFYPDPDCPPHFYAGGNDPQFAGFSKLMPYVNQVSHLLYGAERQVPGLILYHAELEWMNDTSMPMEEPAKVLYDNHIGYDIVPLDALASAEVLRNTLQINGHCYRFLVIPQARRLPKALTAALARFAKAGFPVFYINSLPDCIAEGACVPLDALADTVKAKGLAHCYGNCPQLLRISGFCRESAHYYMLFNEGTTEAACTVSLPVQGDFLRLSLLRGKIERDSAACGQVSLCLAPGESEILVFDAFTEEELAAFASAASWKEAAGLEGPWAIATLETGRDAAFVPYLPQSPLFNITGPQGKPDFSGIVRYTTVFTAEAAVPMLLDLGKVGFTARVFLNGKDLGTQICAPYRFDLTAALRQGENTLEIHVANTLVQRNPDYFSTFMQIPPSGLLGPVTLLTLQG